MNEAMAVGMLTALDEVYEATRAPGYRERVALRAMDVLAGYSHPGLGKALYTAQPAVYAAQWAKWMARCSPEVRAFLGGKEWQTFVAEGLGGAADGAGEAAAGRGKQRLRGG